MDEQEKEEVRKQAKQILDKFSKTLESVKFKEKKAEGKMSGFREEGQGSKGDEEFRKRMFDNAPEKNEDFIIAEKKKW